MKIAIVATYFDRLPQLINTITSLNRYNRDDFVFIPVDDGSPMGLTQQLNNQFAIYPIRIHDKRWYNSAVPFNQGFREALSIYDPEIVIIQNAECYHAGDILGYAEKHLTDKNYIAFPCYSLSQTDTLPPRKMNPWGASNDGDSAWYQHPMFRRVGYHFCAAITADNLRKLNGFDERFKDGIGYDDNYFIHQIKNLGLKIEMPPEPFVYHQWHYANKNNNPALIQKNADLYRELATEGEYRAQHIITPGL